MNGKRPLGTFVFSGAAGLMVAVSAVCGVAGGCKGEPVYVDYTASDQVQSPLVDNIMSFCTPDEVRRQLGEGSPWVVVVHPDPLDGDVRPRFDVLGVDVPGYQHLGHVGRLRLGFINERLHSTLFFPNDEVAYFGSLKEEGVVPDEGGEVEVPPFSRISSQVGKDGRRCVLWSDERLNQQKDLWIRFHSVAGADHGADQ